MHSMMNPTKHTQTHTGSHLPLEIHQPEEPGCMFTHIFQRLLEAKAKRHPQPWRNWVCSKQSRARGISFPKYFRRCASQKEVLCYI